MRKILMAAAVVVFLMQFAIITESFAGPTTYTFDNAGGNNDWSTVSNWAGSVVCPSTGDAAVNANVLDISAGLAATVNTAIFTNAIFDQNDLGLTLTATNGATFLGTSQNYGTITGDAIFGTDGGTDRAVNRGAVTGTTTFYSNSDTYNALTGTISTGIFYNRTYNQGTATTCTFHDDSANYGTTGKATFYDNSYNGKTVTGNAIFNDATQNIGGMFTGTVNGYGFFGPSATNTGTVGTRLNFSAGRGAFGAGHSGNDVAFILSTGDDWTTDTSAAGWGQYTTDTAGVYSWTLNNDSSIGTGGVVTGNVTFNGTGTSAGDIEGSGNVIKTGSDTTTLSGINTYTGTTTISSGTLALSSVLNNNIYNSSNINIASGAYLDTTGLGVGGIVLGINQTLGGSGTVTGKLNVTNGSTISPGNSPGTLNNAGNVTYSGGSHYTWEINDATGTAGTNPGWDLHSIVGGLTINATSANKFTIAINSLTLGNIPGDTANFSKTTNYAWTLTETTTGISGFSADAFNLDATNFTNDISGTRSNGYFGIQVSGNLLELLYHAAVGTNFASDARNGNAFAVGTTLDGITSPTGDMSTVIDALSSLPTADSVNSALNTLYPTTDNSTPQVTHETLGSFVGAVSGHLNNLRLAQASDETGVSTGDEPADNGIWAQGFGTFLHQNPQGSSNGYNAIVYGTAIGYDRSINSDLRLGGSFGYANDNISSKDNSNHTDIDSYQATVYAGLTKSVDYLNAAFSFAYNCYSSLRNIVFPGINRRADSNYGGQQYGLYLEGGHGFQYGKFELTPLASIEYQHLNINSYTEKNADALNLMVNRQGYNMAQSGLGAKAAYSFEGSYGTFIPELHAKWLYDIVNDNQQSTSTFTGGGASFPTQGFRPSKSSANVGTKLTLVTRYNIELSLNYDFQAKKDFYGHSGYVNVRYSF
ncbi:MAG: autotransporter domain-containing protein [Dehalococcoidales bacterium]|nr:autotransporter domain-containing protein [Dehalococcoidales bacterium]